MDFVHWSFDHFPDFRESNKASLFVILTLCMLGSFSYFLLSSADFFKKISF